MENQNVVILKRHPRALKFTNPFYTNQCPDLSERIIVDLTSRNPDRNFSRQVSPFYVGPVVGPDGAQANNLELFWQSAKVFPHHDDGGQPNRAYFEYRRQMYSSLPGEIPKPLLRHPYRQFGYEPEDMLYWPYWNEEKGV